MKALRFLLLFAAVPLFGADKADFTLNDGRVLKGAVITAITGETVAISYEEGAINVPADNVPLDMLVRAKDQLDAETKKKQSATGASLAAPRLSPLAAEQKLIDLKKGFPTATKAKIDLRTKGLGVYEYEVPDASIYSYYHGTFQVMTLDNAPTVLAQMQTRLSEDATSLRKRASATASQSESAKFRASADWLEKQVKPYLAKAKALR